MAVTPPPPAPHPSGVRGFTLERCGQARISSYLIGSSGISAWTKAKYSRGVASHITYVAAWLRAVSFSSYLVPVRGGTQARAWKPREARNEGGLSNLAHLVTRVVICVSRTFCSTDQEKRETVRSLRCSRPRTRLNHLNSPSIRSVQKV